MKELNLVVFGASRSGKTQLITRYTQHTFTEVYDATIEDRYIKETSVDGCFNLLKILDTQGIEQFRDRRNVYIESADGFILVYDTSNAGSLSELDRLMQSIKDTKPFSPLVVVGTKVDKHAESNDAIRVGARLAASVGSPHVLTSAKQGRQVDNVFEAIVRQKSKQQQHLIYRNHTVGSTTTSSTASIEGWAYSPSERGVPRHQPSLKSSMIRLKKSMSKLRGSKSVRSIRKAMSTASFAKSPASNARPLSHHQMTVAQPGCRVAQPTTETATLKASRRSETEPQPILREAGGGEDGLDEPGIHTVTQSHLSELPRIVDVSDQNHTSKSSGTCLIM